jgi:hypothetical protein
MIISPVTITEVATKNTLLQNPYPICYTDFLDQFSRLEYRGFNHFGSLILRDTDEMQFDIVLGIRRGSIRSLGVNYTDVIACRGGILLILIGGIKRAEYYYTLFFKEWSEWRI